MDSNNQNFWNETAETIIGRLNTSLNGLSDNEALSRLKQSGKNIIGANKGSRDWMLLLKQFKSPIVLILLFASFLSFFLQDNTDALIILAIVLISGLLSFSQEYGAANAVRKLLEIIQIKVHVIRNGIKQDVPLDEIVPGDITELSAGDMIPGDCLLMDSRDLFVNEASLTGESYPSEKFTGTVAAETPVAKRHNVLFMGTNVVSGTARALVVSTGMNTQLGQISGSLQVRPPETDFQRGIRRFGNLLLEVTLLFVISIFAINVFLHKPIVDAFLFSLAIAVGLTPQLLPAIISVNLSYGARRMAEKKVIVKVLESIENFRNYRLIGLTYIN